MSLVLYNTLTRREEPFEPLDPPMVRFYSCGPTVYDFAHIGNFRSFVNADLLRRYLEYSGYTVRHVMNITDVGHMVDDDVADGSGEDKMEVARKRLLEQKKAGTLPDDVQLDEKDPMAIANYYAQAFLDDARMLGIKVAVEAADDPSLMPRPTQFVEQMVAMVEQLIERGHAYVGADGVVYFSVQSYPKYGSLSNNTLDELRSGAGGRVNESTQSLKKHPADFMMWKPDPTHLMRWASPWGEGYPGWHLECSVMARDLLGQDTNGVIDLHSGGEDNIFPHHECEIAQSCGASGESHFARYWFHTRHLIVEGEKMSKSKGNFFTLRDLIGKGYEPGAIRLELIKTHYRINANLTMQGLKDSQRMVHRWRAFIEKAEQGTSQNDTAAVEQAFADAMDNDLNVAGALGSINSWMNETPDPGPNDAAALKRFDTALGVLSLETPSANTDLDVDRIEALIVERKDARANKDFKRADEIRDELAAMKVEIKDSPDGTTWSRMLD